MSAMRHAYAAGLVRVRGANAALGGADGFFAEGGFLGGVHFLVEGEDHVGAVGDEKVVLRDGDALPRSSLISSTRPMGSSTTPLPMTQSLPGHRMPEGTR